MTVDVFKPFGFSDKQLVTESSNNPLLLILYMALRNVDVYVCLFILEIREVPWSADVCDFKSFRK